MDTQPISWPEDDLGPASVTRFRLPEGCRAVVVLDNLTLGPAIGGLRLSRGVRVVAVSDSRGARIRATITEMLARTRAGDVSPRRAGLDMATTRLASAQAYRRRF